ncbi:MAG: hypothetical protein L0G05_06430 [Chryseobacterium sp.]|nr:hypothetical protein [Chryseobacterium sp.]
MILIPDAMLDMMGKSGYALRRLKMKTSLSSAHMKGLRIHHHYFKPGINKRIGSKVSAC